MHTNLTEIVFILDRSGSMSGLESDTIGSYNSMLEKQKAEPGAAFVTTVLFDNEYETLHDRVNIKDVAPVTRAEYFVRGSTALLDAIGRTINKINALQERCVPDSRAQKVIFVIITDGMENSSREYTAPKVKAMVEKQKEAFGWEFIFLGANIDAIATARSFGINADRAANYRPDGAGTRLNFAVASEAVSQLRANKTLSADWKSKIDQDFKNRK